MGQVSGLVNTPGQTAGEIVKEMMDDTIKALGAAGGYLKASSKL